MSRLPLALLLCIVALAQEIFGALPPIRLAIDEDFPPYSFLDEHGKLQGLTVDLLDLLQKELGRPIELEPYSWSKAVTLATTHQVDGLANCDSTLERAKSLLFTRPIFSQPMALYVRKESPYQELADLRGHKVALKKSSTASTYATRHYPSWQTVYTGNTSHSLLLLANREVEAVFDWYNSLRFDAEHMLESDIRVARIISSPEIGHTRLALRKDQPELARLLDSGLAILSTRQNQELFQKWARMVEAPPLLFSPEEEAYLATRPRLRYTQQDSPPLAFTDSSGNLSGLSGEYLDYIHKVTGIEFVPVASKGWQDVLELFKQGEIDLVPLSTQSGMPSKALYSEGYLPFPLALLALKETPFIEDLSRLQGQNVAVRKQSNAAYILAHQYPDIKAMACEEAEQCLDWVSQGKAIAFMGNLAVLSSLLREERHAHLRLAGTTGFSVEQYMALQTRHSLALSIIDKVMRSIPEEQRQQWKQRWLSVRIEKETDMALVYQVAGAACILLLLALAWISYQHNMNRKLSSAMAAAEKAEAFSKELQVYFDQSTELLSMMDMQGNFLRLNPQWKHTLGYEIASMEGKSFLSFIYPDDLPTALEFLGKLYSDKQACVFVNRFRALDGEYRYLEWKCVPTGEDRIVNSAQDVTTLFTTQQEKDKLYNRVQQKNEELERFAYTISHDLRSPLVTIDGFAAEILADLNAKDYALIPESVDRIRQATAHMNLLMQGLLHIARIGREVAPFQPVDLNITLQSVAELMQGPIGQSGATLEIARPLPTISGDGLRLRELFQNLIENAIKYQRPSVPPHIRVYPEDVGSFWVLHVEDNGRGIPQDKQESVFEIFSQLDKNSPGVGVGLALVKRITELHGGTVKLQSSPEGPGCLVSLYMPKGP